MNKKIGIIGMGYVGLPLAVEFSKKMAVIGFDTNEKRINELKTGNDSNLEVPERDLVSLKNLFLTSNSKDIGTCDIYIITVPTPIDGLKNPDLSAIKYATEIVALALKQGDLVIYESTTFPGCTEEFCVPILEEKSGLKFNVGFYCGYSPERINPGDELRKLTDIKKVTSGSTPEAAELVDQLYSSIIIAGTHKAPSIKVAECSKVLENIQRDVNIGLINELSLFFKSMEIDTLDVLRAAETKWNFSSYRPGLVGGHCIGVDPYYVTFQSKTKNIELGIVTSARLINEKMADIVADTFVNKMVRSNINLDKARVAVMGLTFKENCPDTRNSKVIDLINRLKTWGIHNIFAYDPFISSSEMKERYGFDSCEMNIESKFDGVIVAVKHKEYLKINLKELRSFCGVKKPVLADLKSIFDINDALKEGFSVYRL